MLRLRFGFEASLYRRCRRPLRLDQSFRAPCVRRDVSRTLPACVLRLSTYRYQLAHMAYALGLAHYHRLPGASCVFKTTFEKLSHRMLRPRWN